MDTDMVDTAHTAVMGTDMVDTAHTAHTAVMDTVRSLSLAEAAVGAALTLPGDGCRVGPDGALAMWIGRRARDKATFPGMLDNLVAGGQPIGMSLMDNLVKECGEEAGIPPALAGQAVAAGEVGYCAEIDGALKPDTMFCYDLELPADFIPVNTDGSAGGVRLNCSNASVRASSKWLELDKTSSSTRLE